MPQLVCQVRGNMVIFPEEKKIFIIKTIQVHEPKHCRKREGLMINLYGYKGKWNKIWSEQRRIDLMKVRQRKSEIALRAIEFININGFTTKTIK